MWSPVLINIFKIQVAGRQSVPLSEYMRVVQELEAARKSYAQLESCHARVTPPPLTPVLLAALDEYQFFNYESVCLGLKFLKI